MKQKGFLKKKNILQFSIIIETKNQISYKKFMNSVMNIVHYTKAQADD